MSWNYKDLEVWKKSFELSKAIYIFTTMFERPRFYGLIDQVRRSAVSIPSNIAEGCGRKTSRDFCRFIDIAQGSKSELETQLMIFIDLTDSEKARINGFLAELQSIGKMLTGLRKSLQRSTTTKY